MAIKKPSYRDLERKAKSYLNATNTVMDIMVDKLTMERLHADIHKEVNRMVSAGEMTKHELFQWRLRWDSQERENNVPANELADYLGLPNLRNNYLAIYEFTSKEVANELTAFYLSLE